MAELPIPNACVDLHATPNDTTAPLVTIPRVGAQNTASHTDTATGTDSTSKLKSLQSQLEHAVSIDAQSLNQSRPLVKTLPLFIDMVHSSLKLKDTETRLGDSWESAIQRLHEENVLIRYLLAVSELLLRCSRCHSEDTALELGRSRYTAFAVVALQKKFSAEEAQTKLSDTLKQLAQCQDALRQSLSLLAVSTAALGRVDGKHDVKEACRKLSGQPETWEDRRDAVAYAFKPLQLSDSDVTLLIWSLLTHESWCTWVCALVFFIVMTQ